MITDEPHITVNGQWFGQMFLPPQVNNFFAPMIDFVKKFVLKEVM
jgi:hypothetical protein